MKKATFRRSCPKLMNQTEVRKIVPSFSGQDPRQQTHRGAQRIDDRYDKLTECYHHECLCK